MDHILLREYISFLITEKIRTIKKGSPFGNKFNLRDFKNLENINIMNVYAFSFLGKMGEGSSRAAYVLTGNKVLKIATNEKGLSQNETEVSVYTNPASRQMVSKIYDVDTDYRWLIVDTVKPFVKEEEFEEATGISFQIFIKKLILALKSESQTKNKLILDTAATMKSNDLLMGDIALIDHWGLSADGRIVLLDYGFTKEVWEMHYQPPNPHAAEVYFATERLEDENPTQKNTLPTLKKNSRLEITKTAKK